MPNGELYYTSIRVTERAGNIGRDKYLTSHALVERIDSEGDAKQVVEAGRPGPDLEEQMIQKKR